MDTALTEQELKLFVDSVRHYFKTTTSQAPQITSAYLATGEVQGYEFTGVISFTGSHTGQIMVSMPAKPLRELLLLQGERDLSDHNLLDAVGEIANTLAGNARKSLGAGLQISTPMKLQGASGIKARVRQHPYVITLRWNHQQSLVCIDMQRKA